MFVCTTAHVKGEKTDDGSSCMKTKLEGADCADLQVPSPPGAGDLQPTQGPCSQGFSLPMANGKLCPELSYNRASSATRLYDMQLQTSLSCKAVCITHPFLSDPKLYL